MAEAREYSDDVIVEAIRTALAAADMPAVDALMRRLAVQNPHLAGDLLDTMRLGLALADRS